MHILSCATQTTKMAARLRRNWIEGNRAKRPSLAYITAITLSVIFAVASCSNETPQQTTEKPTIHNIQPSTSNTTSTTIRQTADNGLRLPFNTKFPNRWSELNDGTDYEPCTALTYEDLTALAIIPSTAADIALANHQTARGCGWSLSEPEYASINQQVGNSSSLQAYSSRYSNVVDWRPSININNRQVLVGVEAEQPSCTTVVQSKRAAVITTVDMPVNPLALDQICAKAIAFTKATIDKMPP